MIHHDIRTAILALRAKGHGTRSIARALKVSRGAVREVLKSGSPEVPRPTRPEKASELEADIRELHQRCKGNLVRVHEELLNAGATLSYPALIRSGTLPEAVQVSGDSEPAKTDPRDVLVRRVITVEGTNDEWTSTGVAVEAGDWIALSASGKVSGTTADGVNYPVRAPNTRRALTYKIGTGAPAFAGSSNAVMATSSGTLNLRVFDTDYSANQGTFVVHLILVRPSLLKTPQQQETTENIAESNLESSTDVEAVRQRYKSVNDRQRLMTKTTKSIWG